MPALLSHRGVESKPLPYSCFACPSVETGLIVTNNISDNRDLAHPQHGLDFSSVVHPRDVVKRTEQQRERPTIGQTESFAPSQLLFEIVRIYAESRTATRCGTGLAASSRLKIGLQALADVVVFSQGAYFAYCREVSFSRGITAKRPRQ